MKKKLFKNRILSDGKVFLNLLDCVDVLETDLKTLKNVCETITEIPPYGEFLSEDEFNYVRATYFPESPALEQYTHYETLDTQMARILNLYFLKHLMFEKVFVNKAKALGMTPDEYIEKVDFPKEVEKQKEHLKNRETMLFQIEKYEHQLEEAIKTTKNIPFEKFGLSLQHLTIVENGFLRFRSYYVGVGIFYETDPDIMQDDMWEEAYYEDGTIYLPTCYGELQKLTKNTIIDFRKHDLKENLMHIVECVDAKDEFDNYLKYSDGGGINIELDKVFLAKLINPYNFLNVYYIDGIPDISGN